MKKFIMPTIAFFVTFAIVFSLLGGLFTNVAQTVTSDDSQVEEVDFGVPVEWAAEYGITINNFLDAELDIDNDGLTLKQEYEYGTNPQKTDTDDDGYADGTEVANGYSPTGEGLMDKNANGLPDTWEKKYGLSESVDKFDDDDKDGLVLYDEYLFGTNPQKTDTDGDGYSDGKEISNGYDPAAPGDVRPSVTIEIDKINAKAPVILSTDATESELQKDLNGGVIKYPGTSMPGQRGNMYVAGHSSNFIWASGSYNNIFKNLNDLVAGDEIIVRTKQENGKEFEYKYIVDLVEEVASDDERIFANTQSQELTLTTCWPLGTNLRRIMVKSKLISV